MTQNNRSLGEVHNSVNVPAGRSRWRRLLAFLGPAYLISVGYMDPGNWATDIAGGSAFGYKLLWVLLMSNMMALLLQSLSVRLGIVRGLDLAQASRHTYPPWINLPLYFLAEIAIAACDLAEVIGMAIGLHLLFDIPVMWGVIIAAFDTLLILFLMNKGMRMLEVFIISIVALIGLAFLTEMFIVKPEITEVFKGLVPSELNGTALYIAIGIIGATVMPHNLYLHSSLVQTRRHGRDAKGIKEALRFNFIDTAVALNLAFLVNAAILILAAAGFHRAGYFDVAEIDQAYQLLGDLFGELSPTLFALALIAAGQSSTITGTLAGQIVMEGYLDLRIRPWLRRLTTRLIAIIPAVFCILYFGDDSLGRLLVFSQVVLSLQLGFAVIPLIHFCSDKLRMGDHVIPGWAKLLSWLTAIIIVVLNAKLVYEEVSLWIDGHGWGVMPVIVLIFLLAAIMLLLYITIAPFVSGAREAKEHLHQAAPALDLGTVALYRKIGITVDYSDHDRQTITAAVAQGGHDAQYVLIHITESAVARYHGSDSSDLETLGDANNLDAYVEQLSEAGYTAEGRIGHGNAPQVIAELVTDAGCDLLVMGAHGHRGLKDILLGTTLDAVRHKVKVPVFIVQ